LCNETFPYALRIANLGLETACARDPGLREAVNMHDGIVTNQAVAETFAMAYTPFD
jgi:alanine dehydrogenase